MLSTRVQHARTHTHTHKHTHSHTSRLNFSAPSPANTLWMDRSRTCRATEIARRVFSSAITTPTLFVRPSHSAESICMEESTRGVGEEEERRRRRVGGEGRRGVEESEKGERVGGENRGRGSRESTRNTAHTLAHGRARPPVLLFSLTCITPSLFGSPPNPT